MDEEQFYCATTRSLVSPADVVRQFHVVVLASILESDVHFNLLLPHALVCEVREFSRHAVAWIQLCLDIERQ